MLGAGRTPVATGAGFRGQRRGLEERSGVRFQGRAGPGAPHSKRSNYLPSTCLPAGRETCCCCTCTTCANKHDQESIEMGLFQHCSTLERTSCFHGLRLLSNIWLKLSGCGTGKDITKVPYMWRITELPLIPHSTVAQGNVILNSIITYLLTYLDHNSDLLCPLLR